MDVDIRTERKSEGAQTRAVHEAAFPTAAEADLVDALRGTPAWRDELSLVAVLGDRVVGHLLVSEARLDSGIPVLALAPMAVVPSVQGRGVGARLVREALARAAGTEHPLVVVLGHADYYPRFGFSSARALGVHPPFDVPDAVWMALPLPSWTPDITGTVVYPSAFDAV